MEADRRRRRSPSGRSPFPDSVRRSSTYARRRRWSDAGGCRRVSPSTTSSGSRSTIAHGVDSRRAPSGVAACPLVASAQDVTQRGDDGPALPEGAIAEREFRLIVGTEDVQLFTPKPQILPVGERCARLKQACEFEAEIAERGALEYRWHAETEHARVFGATELPRFLVQFRSPSPSEGYKVKLLARRLDSPGRPVARIRTHRAYRRPSRGG